MNHLLPAIAWTLIHFCWQAAAIAALYGVASLALTRRSSQTRYAVALAALLLMLASAVFTFAWQLRATASPARAAMALAAAASTPLQEAVAQPIEQTRSVISPDAAYPSLPTLLPWIDGFWLVGVFALSLRSLGGWWLIRRLRASASSAIPAAVNESFAKIASALGLQRPVELAVTGSVSGPITVGFLRATVLLPLCALTALGPDELEVVLAHELAHVRRADFLWNLVQTFAETLFFFHPAVWWIGGCLRSERELCCDDLALKVCPNPVIYARALFHLEEQRSRQPRLAMALDGNGSRSTLRLRILRILGEPVAHTGHAPSRAFSISVAIAGLLLLVLPSSQVLASLHPAHAANVTGIKLVSSDKVVALPADAVERPQAPATPAPAPAAAAAVTPAAPEPETDPQEPAPAPEKPAAGTHTSTTGHSTYIDRMKAAGYEVDLDKYISMKIQGVTPEYAQAMSQIGFGKLSADDLVSCKIQGVSPEAIQEMKKQGLEVSSVHDAISYRIFSVTPEFIAGMKAAGFTNLNSKQLIGLRVQGVTPEYARSITKEFPGANVDEIVKTKIFNIDGDFIASAKAHGFGNLSLEKLVKLRISGILDDEK
jgi:beta-lactamase regulating signal transducer with metallopeptidase domain